MNQEAKGDWGAYHRDSWLMLQLTTSAVNAVVNSSVKVCVGTIWFAGLLWINW